MKVPRSWSSTDDAVGAQRRGHLLLAVDVVVIAENGEAAVASHDPRQDARDHARRHPAAAEQLHVDVVAAEQHEVRQERRDLPGDRRVARTSSVCEPTCRSDSNAMRSGRSNRGQPGKVSA